MDENIKSFYALFWAFWRFMENSQCYCVFLVLFVHNIGKKPQIS
jgi:hypothetical protein